MRLIGEHARKPLIGDRRGLAEPHLPSGFDNAGNGRVYARSDRTSLGTGSDARLGSGATLMLSRGQDT
jgi:hypothetical protein